MKRSITLFCTLLLLIVSAVPAFASKVLADIEYFYADDGTLIGKAFNGKRVNFEYDLRGQLLAVKDAYGNDLERYTYDPAGNRLSKTINGVTTTYTYDKANQLVTSTVNGVTTHYKYDAAGRMIQAGDKKYIYNGNNKVVAIWQNGDIIAKFEYNIDGQIAKAIYGDKVEEFMWDGLALIWRSGVTYINEPYVTGGNPVMAGDEVLFNDMLGSTLAVNGNPVEMTSFGETTDKNAFFTGKPMIDELGYSFLFRDYNPNQGKWTTTDPLGYPDGWNNLAYVNNKVVGFIDFLGAKVYWCARDLAGFPVGNHHFLAFIPDNPNDFTGKTVDMGGGSQGWTNGGQPKGGKLVSTPNEGNDLQSVRELRDPQNYPPGTFSDWDGEMHEIPTPQGMTDTQFINALQKAIDEYQNNYPFSLVDENCAAWVNSMLERVGIPKSERDRLGEFFGVDWGEEDLIPSQYFVKE